MAKHNIEDTVFAERQSVKPLDVIVVGAGIGGLMMALCLQQTGHNVRILEKRRNFSEVGAGIQIAPNATRILRRFGLLEETMRHATVLQRTSIRRWKNNEELGLIPLAPRVADEFGAPLAVIHRADLQHVLRKAALANGCEVLTDCSVVEVDFGCPPYHRRVLVRNRGMTNWLYADIVIAVDGMNSCIRKKMLAAAGIRRDYLVPTGHTAFRFTLHRDLVKDDKEVMQLISQDQAVRYMGPRGHIMSYPLRNNTQLNVVLVCNKNMTDNESAKSSWTSLGDKRVMMQKYQEWCPLVQSLVRYVPEPEVLETVLVNLDPLPTWVMGQVALAGDACHQMLPYVAQGAANAIEDAATLAMALTCTDDIPLALEVYQLVRKSRSERIAASATKTGDNLHMPDGEAQRQRDVAIRAGSRGEGENPDRWNDRECNKFMWGVDVMAVTLLNWEALAHRAKRRTRGDLCRL
ncbi:putative salicylate hydroxylase [Xylariaceae sp. FL0255]|nr:putative salicylate hydroxylase [Xylariaceae sp. FL0255]